MSTLIVVIVRSETIQSQTPVKKPAITPLQNTFGSPFILAMVQTKKIGCTTKPTPKSDKARPTSRTFEGECKDGVLQIEMSTRRLPSVADREVSTVKMQLIIWTAPFPSISNAVRSIEQQHLNSWVDTILWLPELMLKSSHTLFLLYSLTICVYILRVRLQSLSSQANFIFTAVLQCNVLQALRLNHCSETARLLLGFLEALRPKNVKLEKSKPSAKVKFPSVVHEKSVSTELSYVLSQSDGHFTLFISFF